MPEGIFFHKKHIINIFFGIEQWTPNIVQKMRCIFHAEKENIIVKFFLEKLDTLNVAP